MKRFSAQYVITNSGAILKRGVVTTDDNGVITAVEDTGGVLEEKHSTEFFDGIIIPGFVNCHCHLELSHMRGAISEGTGLGSFISEVRNSREEQPEQIVASALKADSEMYSNGIELCADICNTDNTFDLKRKSKVRYINLLEVFGIDPDKAGKKIEELSLLAEKADRAGLKWFMVPHAAYSISRKLLRLLKAKSSGNKITSIHFMETPSEKEFLEIKTGALSESYDKLGLSSFVNYTVKGHSEAVLNEITESGNLILVHNTFADRKTIMEISERKNLFWCLCPDSNLYIESEVPPVDLLREEKCEIVIGTDSLASNKKLDILDELKTLQLHFAELKIPELVKWATLNGARALGEEKMFGSIEKGKKPGLLLIENADLHNLKLLPASSVRRLV